MPIDVTHLPDFETAARAVLDYLHRHLGFSLWMVTRTEGNAWIVLQACDHGYGVHPGDVFQWTDSFCSRMVAEQGPRIAPCSAQVQAYAHAPIAQQVPIGAYVGVPLINTDGSLFGTLCAIDPQSQPEAIAKELPLVELLASLLSSILHADLRAAEQTRLADQQQSESMHDVLTGLYNRRGWDYLLSQEEQRCLHYGHLACVLSLDLDELKQVNDTYGHSAGDLLLQRAASVISQSIRKQDVAARVGGDEFAILVVECALSTGQQLVQRLQTALAAASVKASVGLAVRHPSQGLPLAWVEADQAMYAQKRQRLGAGT